MRKGNFIYMDTPKLPNQLAINKSDHEMNPKTIAVIAFLRDNMSSNLSMKQLAYAANASPSHVGHVFRLDTGLTPFQYLKLVRLESSRELLETSLLSIKEIASRVGFGDVSHFVRDFKNHFGCWPREYRIKFHQKLIPDPAIKKRLFRENLNELSIQGETKIQAVQD